MNDYQLVMFFLKSGNKIHEAVEKASRIIDLFGSEVRETKDA